MDSVPDMLSHIARCQPLHLAVAVFDSAMRTHLISREELEQLALVRDDAFTRVMSKTDETADSGIESMPRVLMALEGIPMRAQVMIDGHPVDGLVGECLVLQFDGFGPHSSRSQRNRDLQQDARLMLRGYTVLRFSSDAVVFTPGDVMTTVRLAIAEGKHLWPRTRTRVGRT